ncbi:hypothetical protein NHX12_011273 [Muraenolepis orangiensis]|uniref:GPCR-2037 n=1 Tax=Muraenolepis orangiensis TaxID=630683 RepID=A0A9Q0DG06_9TELE|nr:hypothetical protein NHX12_011273 [Muraenolepis orangiensis]
MDIKLSGWDNGTAVRNSSVEQRFYPDWGSYQHLTGELRVAVPALLGVLCITGLACNLTAMAILVSNGRRGKLSLLNALLFNLMFADGLVLAFSAPLRAAAYQRSSWTLGRPACKAADWFLQSCMVAKSFTVAVMARACYRYVSNPTKQVSVRLGSILAVLLFTWLAACSVTAPHWLFSALRRESRGPVCVLAPPPETRGFMWVYAKAFPLGVFCAPLSFALLYFWKAYGRCQRHGSKNQNLRTQIRSRKLTLMLFGLTVAMALLWLPHWVVWVWERHLQAERGESEPVPSSPPLLLSLSAQLLTFSLSLVNPLVVLSLSEEFREGYRGLWRRLTMRKQPLPKPGPHNPTSLMSPCPRPETSGQAREEGCASSVRGPKTAESPRGPPSEAEEEKREDGAGQREADRTSLKDGPVFPDVEQFWHERGTGSLTDENDPVPWENQGTTVGEGGRQ